MAPSDRGIAAENIGPKITIVSSIFAGLATLAVLGRFWARRLKGLEVGSDDYVTVAALVCDWVFYGMMMGSIPLGLGQHIKSLQPPPDHVMTLFKLLYVSQLFYILGTIFVKASLLLLYKRVFISTTFVRTVYAVSTFLAIYGIIFVFMAIFNCTPVQGFWTKEGWCFDFRGFAIGYAVVNISTDFTIWLLPIPMVWNLHLPIGQKIALSLIFLIGLFDTASAIARLILSMLTLDNPDFTWFLSDGYMWSIIEISCGIICACLPTMRVVIITLLPKPIRRLFSSAHKSRATNATKTWPQQSRSTYDEITNPESTEADEGVHSNRIALSLMNGPKPKNLAGITVERQFKVQSEPRPGYPVGTAP